MSRLSDAKEFKKNQEEIIKAVAAIGSLEVLDKTNLACIGDTLIRCLELLAEIADMLEEKTEKEEKEA